MDVTKRQYFISLGKVLTSIGTSLGIQLVRLKYNVLLSYILTSKNRKL